MRQYIDTLQDVNGNALVGASVLVNAYQGGSPASIFSDNGLTPILTSTVNTGADGQFNFFAADGDYSLVLSKGGTTFKTQSPVSMFDGAAQLTYTDTGTVNALLTSNNALEKALRTGLRAYVKVAVTNTGATTFSYNGLIATAVVNADGSALAAGELVGGGIYQFEYNGTAWQLASLPAPAFYARTAREITAGVTPTNYGYAPGVPRRFGAVGNGIADDSVPLRDAIISCATVSFYPGDIYGVQTVLFDQSQQCVFFNGGSIQGLANAGAPQVCIARVTASFCTFFDWEVNQYGNGGSIPNPNPNYQCATWIYNGSASLQWNAWIGMLHSTCKRAIVYGALPGNAATGGIQSENVIYGARFIGCSNPFYANAPAGVINLTDCILYSGAENWTVAFPTTARFLENQNGTSINVKGGEWEYASTSAGFAADLAGITATGVNIEVAPPINIVGACTFVGCNHSNTSSTTSAFRIAATDLTGATVTGELTWTGGTFVRALGTGGFSRVAMIDSTANATYRVVLQSSESFEWAWSLVGNTCRLIAGGIPIYKQHRLSITNTDVNLYYINSPLEPSILPTNVLDNLGYTLTGWNLNTVSGGTETMTVTASTGPTGYLASQITIVSSGTLFAGNSLVDTLAHLQAGAIRVRPGEVYWLSGWLNATAGASQAYLLAQMYSLTGANTAGVAAADITAIGTGSWTYVEGPVVVPAGTAYMVVGTQINVGTLAFTDIRVKRA